MKRRIPHQWPSRDEMHFARVFNPSAISAKWRRAAKDSEMNGADEYVQRGRFLLGARRKELIKACFVMRRKADETIQVAPTKSLFWNLAIISARKVWDDFSQIWRPLRACIIFCALCRYTESAAGTSRRSALYSCCAVLKFCQIRNYCRWIRSWAQEKAQHSRTRRFIPPVFTLAISRRRELSSARVKRTKSAFSYSLANVQHLTPPLTQFPCQKLSCFLHQICFCRYFVAIFCLVSCQWFKIWHFGGINFY